MAEIALSIDLKLSDKLKDRDYRRKFFLAEASARIAKQIIGLRKRRALNQTQLAELAGTQQPAISRVERADYQNWSFNTLRNIADALDARIRVSIEPSEDILSEYETEALEAKRDVRDLTHEASQSAVMASILCQRADTSLSEFHVDILLELTGKGQKQGAEKSSNAAGQDGTEINRLQSHRPSYGRSPREGAAISAESGL